MSGYSFKNKADVVYDNLEEIEGIIQDMYLALSYKDETLQSKSYKMSHVEAQVKLDRGEDLIAELIKLNRDTHYVRSN